ncbi:Uncharacterised protein [Mycobacteroides abscessus subsp. abscessus]|nr:Uncharacterised protein [Mycobacteroides abscessus subsp. abscessus]
MRSTPRTIDAAAASGVTAWRRNSFIPFCTASASRSTPAISTRFTIGVRIAPGHTRLTPIRCRRRSKRSTSETPRRPNLPAL